MIDKTEDFKKRPSEWRIAAVIHDGSWYDIPKWARVAKVKQDEVKEWVSENVNGNDGFEKKADSYRAKYDEVLNWYSQQDDIDITDKIIPNNYPPRLWGNMTEVEAFMSAPLRDTSTIKFETEDEELLKKCVLALSGVARVRVEKDGKYRAYGLSDTYIRQVLVKALTPKELKSLKIKKRKSMPRRELTDFNQEFIEEAIKFYIPFTRNALKNHMSTIRIFLPNEGEIDSQITIWIIDAIRKFDETKPVPFSGYLNKVLQFWPYDLPDDALGKDLSDFQRKKQKAIQELMSERDNETNFANEEIAEKMGIDFERYVELNSENEVWKNTKNATELNWTDSANEKSGTLVGQSEEVVHNRDLSNSISHAVIKAALNTDNFEEAEAIIESIDADINDDLSFLSEIDDVFKKELGLQLIEMGVSL